MNIKHMDFRFIVVHTVKPVGEKTRYHYRSTNSYNHACDMRDGTQKRIDNKRNFSTCDVYIIDTKREPENAALHRDYH